MSTIPIETSGKLRSIISQEDFSKRALYKDTNQNLKRRATFAGTTNYKELLRNENKNRYMPFKIAEKMDFDLLNSLDIMQVWSQIRDMEKGKHNFRVTELEKLSFGLETSVKYFFAVL